MHAYFFFGYALLVAMRMHRQDTHERLKYEYDVSKVEFSISMHSNYLRLHFQPFGSTPTTLSLAERGTSLVTYPNLTGVT